MRKLDVAAFVIVLLLTGLLVAMFLLGGQPVVLAAEILAYLGILIGIVQVFGQRPVVASMTLLMSGTVLLVIALLSYKTTGVLNPVITGSGAISIALSLYTMYSYARRGERCVRSEADFV